MVSPPPSLLAHLFNISTT